MTIGAWVVVCVVAIIGLAIVGACAFGAVISNNDDEIAIRNICIIGAVATLIITVVSCAVYIWYFNNSERGKRALKDQQSNLSGGITRTVSVYDINGELIQQYSGKFDIETDRDHYILFDDEDGCRHIVYFTTGTIIVDEH